MMDAINLAEDLRHSIERGTRSMPAWYSSGTRQRTKRLEKGASERDTRIDDRSGGSPLTIETGPDFPIGITRHPLPIQGGGDEPATPRRRYTTLGKTAPSA